MQSTELHRADLAFVVNLPLLKCQAEGIGTNLEELKLQSAPLCVKEVGMPGFLLSPVSFFVSSFLREFPVPVKR